MVLAFATATIVLAGCNGQANAIADSTAASSAVVDASASQSKTVQKADKIEVVHFHATQQCWSCTTVGEFALKTIKERFPEEYKNGTIVFRDINGELPENLDMVAKFQARGSSLFINAITGDKENIGEDVRVWRLVYDEKAFLDYFEGKLKELLG